MKKTTAINAGLSQTGIAPANLTEAVFSFKQKENTMKNLRNLLIGLMSLLFVSQIGLVSVASAQSPKQAERQRINRVMDANTNVEEFRQELIDYFTEMEDAARLLNEIPAVRKKLSQDGLRAFETIASAKQQIAQTSPEDLVRMRAAYANFPGWRESPRTINALIKPELRQQLEARLAAKKNGGGIQPNFVTPDNCADAIAADVSNSDIAAAQGASLAAHAIADAVPPILNIPAVAAYAITDAIVIGLATSKAIKDDCTALDATSVQSIVDGAKTEIVNNNNAQTTTIQGSISSATTTITNNDNANKTMLLNNATTNTANISNLVAGTGDDIVNNANSNKAMLTTTVTNAQTSINNLIASSTNNILDNAGANKTMLAGLITSVENDIVNNANSNKTMLATAIANVQASGSSNTTAITTALTNAKNTIIANDNTNTTNIVNNDNANTTTLINSGNANTTALNDLILRSQIEADLATESNAVKVGWYMTPTANGGKLDLVKQIVTLTLANIQAAGGSIGNAQSFLDRANADKAAGNFKSAYDNYRKAYKAAVN